MIARVFFWFLFQIFDTENLAKISKKLSKMSWPNVKKPLKFPNQGSILGIRNQRPKVGTHHTLGSHAQNPQPKAQSCTNSSSPYIDWRWDGWCSMHLGRGVPPHPMWAPHGYAKFSCQPKHFPVSGKQEDRSMLSLFNKLLSVSPWPSDNFWLVPP
jgi:hypothetical protein